MIQSLRKTVATAGLRGLFDGITGTWLRQMTYSMVRLGSYDEIKRWLSGSETPTASTVLIASGLAGGLGGVVGNPAGALPILMQYLLIRPFLEKIFSLSG